MKDEAKKITDRTKIVIGYVFYLVIIVYRHISLGGIELLVSDDNYRYNNPKGMGIIDLVKYYWTANGRYSADAAAEFLIQHYRLWKVLDIIVFLLIAILLCYILRLQKYQQVWVLLGTILLVQFSYLKSAGYVSTTTNYTFTLLGVLFVVFEAVSIVRNDKYKYVGIPFALCGVLYASCHDQYSVVNVLICMLMILYMVIYMNKEPYFKNNLFMLIVLTMLVVVAYIVVFSSPGHLQRMNSVAEMEQWLPQYADWSFAKKIYEGFSTTISNLLYKRVDLFVLLTVVIAIRAICHDKVLYKIIGMIPVSVLVLASTIGVKTFYVEYEYACGMPDLLEVSEGAYAVLGVLLSVLICIAILLSTWILPSDRNTAFLTTGVMLTGALSREMMGFSATIYASSYRTFIPFLFCIIVAILLIVRDIESVIGNRTYAYMGIAMLLCYIF